MPAQKIDDFALPSTGGGTFRLSDHAGRRVVLYFYHLHDKFARAGAVIAGISRDSVKSHEGFKSKMGFPFELLSDADEALCQRFGVIKMKNMYGKKVRGIERSTFVIDGQGRLAKEWRGVKVPGHADEVLAFVQSI